MAVLVTAIHAEPLLRPVRIVPMMPDGDRPLGGAGADAEGWEPRLGRLWRGLVDALGALGSLMIGALMVLVCADIVARNGFNTTIPVVAEIGALTVVMIVFLQLGTTVRHERMARAEIFIEGLQTRRPRAGRVVTMLYDAAGAAACGLVAWSTFDIVMKDVEVGEYIGVFGVLTIPTWPFRLLILVGVTVAALQYLYRMACALAALGRRTR